MQCFKFFIKKLIYYTSYFSITFNQNIKNLHNMSSESSVSVGSVVQQVDAVRISSTEYAKLLSQINKSPMDNIMLISGRSCKSLSESLSKSIGKPLTNVTLSTFANSEINVIIHETVRRKDVFVIQTGSSCEGRSINDHIMEAMLIMDTCKRSGANSISIIMPTFAYARSDKKDNSRVLIGGSLMIQMLHLKADRVIAVDIHAGQIQGFTDGPSDNLYCINMFCTYLKKHIFSESSNANDNFILISPDSGGEKRIKAYSKKLLLTSTILTKQRDYSKMNSVTESTLTGDPELVKGKIGIIIDDMIDTFGTMVEGIKELKKHGVENVIVIATHGVLSGSAIDRINGCEEILKVVVTNSICQVENQKRCSKLEVVDLGPFFADIIVRVMNGESLSEMFN